MKSRRNTNLTKSIPRAAAICGLARPPGRDLVPKPPIWPETGLQKSCNSRFILKNDTSRRISACLPAALKSLESCRLLALQPEFLCPPFPEEFEKSMPMAPTSKSWYTFHYVTQTCTQFGYSSTSFKPMSQDALEVLSYLT